MKTYYIGYTDNFGNPAVKTIRAESKVRALSQTKRNEKLRTRRQAALDAAERSYYSGSK